MQCPGVLSPLGLLLYRDTSRVNMNETKIMGGDASTYSKRCPTCHEHQVAQKQDGYMDYMKKRLHFSKIFVQNNCLIKSEVWE